MPHRSTRRRFVSTLGAAASAGLAGCFDATQSESPESAGDPTATATESSPPETEASTPTPAAVRQAVDSYLDDVSNYDGTIVDARGSERTTVRVGVPGNGNASGFGPPAVVVDTGTTVQWEWTGDGGRHNVLSEDDGPLDSGNSVEASGVNYEYSFEEEGLYNYYCDPHQGIGMKGSIVAAAPTRSASADRSERTERGY